MARKKNVLSEAEWRIMEAVWDAERAVSVREVVQKLYPKGERAYTTVQTVMNILVDKGYLRKEKIGMVNFYTPRVARENAVRKATHSLVSKIFHGSFGALAAFLVDSDSLSPEEIRELKSMIARKEREMKERRHD
jgi:predicted transcriptional regulator